AAAGRGGGGAHTGDGTGARNAEREVFGEIREIISAVTGEFGLRQELRAIQTTRIAFRHDVKVDRSGPQPSGACFTLLGVNFFPMGRFCRLTPPGGKPTLLAVFSNLRN